MNVIARTARGSDAPIVDIPGGQTNTSGTLTVSLARTSVSQRRKVLLNTGLAVKAHGTGPVNVRITAKLGRVTLASTTVKTKKAGAFSRKLRPTATGRKALKRVKLPAKITVTITGAAIKTTSRKITIR